MKKIKVAIVRTIMVEDLYEVVITDEKAKEFTKAKDDKKLIADLIDTEYQRANRTCSGATHTEKDVNDRVTFIRMKICDVK